VAERTVTAVKFVVATEQGVDLSRVGNDPDNDVGVAVDLKLKSPILRDSSLPDILRFVVLLISAERNFPILGGLSEPPEAH
jgi:hypothetical protein